jgi:hypothetical protein
MLRAGFLRRVELTQRAIFDAVVKVSEQIQANHDQTMETLAQIQRDLVVLNSIALEDLFGEIEHCRVFRKRLEDHGFRRDRAVSTRLPYGTLRSIDYGEEGDGYGRQCRAGLRAILATPFEPEITYDLARFKETRTARPRASSSTFTSRRGTS